MKPSKATALPATTVLAPSLELPPPCWNELLLLLLLLEDDDDDVSEEPSEEDESLLPLPVSLRAPPPEIPGTVAGVAVAVELADDDDEASGSLVGSSPVA